MSDLIFACGKDRRDFSSIMRWLAIGAMFIALSMPVTALTSKAQTFPQTSPILNDSAKCAGGYCFAKDKKKSSHEGQGARRGKAARTGSPNLTHHPSSKSRKAPTLSAYERAKEWGETQQRAVDTYQRQMTARQRCLENGSTQGCPSAVVPADIEAPAQYAIAHPLGGQAAPPPVVLTPEQAAYIAFARLKLTPPTPGIGPPPTINRWHMAAVGYPLWLWGEGTTNPAPVSDTVGGLFVSLDAHVSKIVFAMGDGTKVTCQGVGKKWGAWVAAGQKSPVCGHIYKKPSLPHGSYKVTATTYWSVAWNVTGQQGVIPFAQTASRRLSVGELQVLVR